MHILVDFLATTAVANMTIGNLLMLVVGMIFISLAIRKDYEPLLLVPIGFGCIVGNIPSIASMAVGVYAQGSGLSYIYFGVSQGIFLHIRYLFHSVNNNSSSNIIIILLIRFVIIDFADFISSLL